MISRLLISFAFVLGIAGPVLGEVLLLVVPSKMVVEPGETINLDVYLKNTGNEVVKVPGSKMVDGYSYCGVYLRTIRYRIEGDIVHEAGKVFNDGILMGFTQDLSPNSTQRYRFRYRVPLKSQEFDFETLDVALRISGKGQSSTITLLRAEQGGAGQPATAPELKPDDSQKPQPESKPASR